LQRDLNGWLGSELTVDPALLNQTQFSRLVDPVGRAN
jgi:hypothetical protein